MSKTGIIAIVCLLAATASRSLATDEKKLSGYVKSLITQPRPAASRAANNTHTVRPTLTAFLRVDADHADEVGKSFGLRYYARKGDLTIAEIPIDCIPSLSDHHAVHRIEASPSATLTMDTTRTITGADKLHTLSSVFGNQAFTGRGVVMGVMDVGFDLTHPNFYDASATNYRIGAFWDQLSKDTVGSTLPVGRDFRGYELVRQQLHSTDGHILSHGTHTLGIAAGSGYDSPYRGIAYDADICLVSNAVNDDIVLIDSADYDKYTSATDALGFKYIFDYADSLGKPCVASFSEGYSPYFDSEDSLYAAFLDSLSTPGHIIVISAGNQSLWDTYMEKDADREAIGTFLQSSTDAGRYTVSADGPIDVSLHAYPKDIDMTERPKLVFRSDMLTTDTVLTDTLFCNGDTCKFAISRYPSAFSADTLYNIVCKANKKIGALGFDIAIVLEGWGTHAELFGRVANLSTDGQWNGARKGHNILSPGNFPAVICVGATAHRMGFTNYEGKYYDYTNGQKAGLLSFYSSTGPTLDGLTKPDVVAPGNNIISSYSSYYLEAKPDANDINSDVEHFSFQERTYAWNANTGTSMSAPVVAGIIALWLQAKPDLSREEIIGVLSRTCRQPVDTLTYPNNQYGYGEIDAYRGLLDILGIDRIEGISLHQPAQLRLTIKGDQLQLLFEANERPTTPLHINVYSLNGSLLHQATLQPSESETHLPPLPKGIYAIQINNADHRFTGSQLIRK